MLPHFIYLYLHLFAVLTMPRARALPWSSFAVDFTNYPLWVGFSTPLCGFLSQLFASDGYSDSVSQPCQTIVKLQHRQMYYHSVRCDCIHTDTPPGARRLCLLTVAKLSDYGVSFHQKGVSSITNGSSLERVIPSKKLSLGTTPLFHGTLNYD